MIPFESLIRVAPVSAENFSYDLGIPPTIVWYWILMWSCNVAVVAPRRWNVMSMFLAETFQEPTGVRLLTLIVFSWPPFCANPCCTYIWHKLYVARRSTGNLRNARDIFKPTFTAQSHFPEVLQCSLDSRRSRRLVLAANEDMFAVLRFASPLWLDQWVVSHQTVNFDKHQTTMLDALPTNGLVFNKRAGIAEIAKTGSSSAWCHFESKREFTLSQ
jgi:hypothetical protein